MSPIWNPTPPTPRTAPARLARLLVLLLGLALLAGTAAPTASLAQEHDEDHEHHDEEHEHDEEDGDDEDWDEEDVEREFMEFEFYAIELELYVQVLEVVRTYGEIADDPSLTGVAAVLAIEEYAEEASDALEVYEQLLPQVTDATVRRAIQLKLLESYRDVDQPQRAMELAKSLVVGAAE
ncbi:MAG: hypothetical protein AAF800_07770 [Planctomycetota bacterium]